MEISTSNRILITDDTKEIHEDFQKILGKKNESLSLKSSTAALLGKTQCEADEIVEYEIDSAFQGQEALEMVCQAKAINRPYSLIFMDVRMPPGWDGIQTIKKIWEIDPDVEVVICTAYSDYSGEDTVKELLGKKNFLILKKPFETIEIQQLANALTTKWAMKKKSQQQIVDLQNLTQKLADTNVSLNNSFSLLKATLEATQEGILVVSKKSQKIITFNKIFLRIWNLKESDLLVSWDNLLIKLSEQVQEKILFQEMMNNLSHQPNTHFIREWVLINNKTVELYTNSEYLENEVIGCVFSFRDITERKVLDLQLLHQATHDSLTGLANRALLIDRLQQAIHLAKRNHMVVAVLLIDLDNFKQVNDCMGHPAGDSLLITAANKLLSTTRESDTVARLGGDEFVVVLLADSMSEALTKKVKNIADLFIIPTKIEGNDFIVTASIGISVFPQDGKNPIVLLKNADTALYQAKESGRNTFQFYQSGFNKNLLEQATLTSALHHAIQLNQLSLHYQPLVNLANGTIEGVEALLRWNHPLIGMIPPLKFIPLAEKSGLIISIGEWVLYEACKQNKLWHDAGYTSLKVAVNVSAIQFHKTDFLATVKKALELSGLEAKYLELEITETLLIEGSESILKKMNELKELGVLFSIDDFGIGYSNLNYLKKFPFDKVKIDKSFIDAISVNNDSDAIVQSIINLTKQMGINVLAEGVERLDQVNYLKRHENNNIHIQGYYFSPPVDARAFSMLLQNANKHKG